LSDDVASRLAELAARYELAPDATPRLSALLDLVGAEPAAITSVRDPAEGVDVHVADSLVALEVAGVRDANTIADLGSGGGFPGLALAVALPQARVALVESVARKCDFLARAIAKLDLENAEVVNARAEAWPEGLAVHDVVTARALAPLSVIVEYAVPLLRGGGLLVAWKGAVEGPEAADGLAATRTLGMSALVRLPVRPFPAAGGRSLYLGSKVSPTPSGYPRRPGMARKRPIRAST
jgi:16S rRNA (guanine527-N7)-methyltransferase